MPGRGPGLRLAWRLGLMAEHPLLVGAWSSTLPPLLLPSGPVLLPPPLDLGGRVEKDPLVRAGGKGVGGRDEGSPSHVGPPHRAAPLSWPRASVPQCRGGASQRGRPECRRARRWCDRVGRGVQGARALCSGCRASDDLTAGGPRLLRTQGCGRGRAWLSRRGRRLRPLPLLPIPISRLWLVGRCRGGAISARPGGMAIWAAIPLPRDTHMFGWVLQKREGNLCRPGVVAALVGSSSGALARLARRRPI